MDVDVLNVLELCELLIANDDWTGADRAAFAFVDRHNLPDEVAVNLLKQAKERT